MMFNPPLHETFFLLICGTATALSCHHAGLIGLLAAQMATPVLMSCYLALYAAAGRAIYLDEGAMQVVALSLLTNTALLPGGFAMTLAFHLRRYRQRRSERAA